MGTELVSVAGRSVNQILFLDAGAVKSRKRENLVHEKRVLRMGKRDETVQIGDVRAI